MIYDYIIVGAGAAGMQLALEFSKDKSFSKCNILVIEKSKEPLNIKTWCYWEEGEGLYDDIIARSWSSGLFYGQTEMLELDMGSYRYKMLEQKAFISYGRDQIEACPWISVQYHEVESVVAISNGSIEVKSQGNSYLGRQVFDSRFDEDIYEKKFDQVKLIQHFKGWHVRTERDCFDPSKFVMMDFRVQDEGTMNFTYVLPLSPKEGLVEFTYFSEQVVSDADYDQYLEAYISKILGARNYEILKIEKGVIPMTTFPFSKQSSENIFKIGTAGGWVKPSTGYSFNLSGKKAKQIIQNIKNGLEITHGLTNKRHGHLDRIFLNVLSSNNSKASELFWSMYRKNKAKEIFKFLDEESTIVEELKIISSFKKMPFLREMFSK